MRAATRNDREKRGVRASGASGGSCRGGAGVTASNFERRRPLGRPPAWIVGGLSGPAVSPSWNSTARSLGQGLC